MTDLERVRKGLVEDGVHSPGTDGVNRLLTKCRYDGEPWPCSTVAALDAHLKKDAELREAVKAYLWEEPPSPFAGSGFDRLRQLIEEKE